MAALLLLAAGSPGGPRFPRGPRARPRDKGPLSVPCSRCGAEPGEHCDGRTLGRHYYHKARADAWKDET